MLDFVSLSDVPLSEYLCFIEVISLPSLKLYERVAFIHQRSIIIRNNLVNLNMNSTSFS